MSLFFKISSFFFHAVLSDWVYLSALSLDVFYYNIIENIAYVHYGYFITNYGLMLVEFN